MRFVVPLGALNGAYLSLVAVASELPLNPAVTQSTIGETICAPGWATTQRPPLAVTAAVKRTLFEREGLPADVFESAILDHRIPIELGGAPADARNFELQEAEESREKDAVEHCARRTVCAGRVTLADAQAAIWRDWRSAARVCE
jgi:hypothetical protein